MLGILFYALLLPGADSAIPAATKSCSIRNGNFEHGPKQSSMKGTHVIGRYSVPEWEISGFVEYIKSGQKQGDMVLVVPEGAAAIRLGEDASIKQRLPVTGGAYYAVTFSAARTCAQEESLNVSASRDWSLLPMQTLYSSNGWDSYAWAFRATAAAAVLVLHNPSGERDPACGPLIDSVAIKALFPPRPTNKNIMKNGGFEEGPCIFQNATWGVLIPPYIKARNSPLPGWKVDSSKAVKFVDSDHFSVPEKKRAVELVAGKESSIMQIARTVAGDTYTLSFAVGDAGNSCKGLLGVEAFAGKEAIKVPYESKGKGGFKHVAHRFVATSTRTRVTFYSTFYTMRSDDISSLCGPVIDDVKLLRVRV